MKIPLLLHLLLLFFILVLSACGGGDDSDSPASGNSDGKPGDSEDQFDLRTLGEQPDWLVGSWTSSRDGRETKSTYNSDGSCTEDVVNYRRKPFSEPAVEGSEYRYADCAWGVTEGKYLNEYASEQPLTKRLRTFQIERISDNDFRIVGDNQAELSYLYTKEISGSIGDEYPGRALLGSWDHHFSGTLEERWTFENNGVLKLVVYDPSTSFSIPSDDEVSEGAISTSEGSWEVTPNQLTINIAGDSRSGTYNIHNVSFKYFHLKDTNDNDLVGDAWAPDPFFDSTLFSRASTALIQQDDPFSGEYVGNETTLFISPLGNGIYHLTVIDEGNRIEIDTRSQGDHLFFDIPDEWDISVGLSDKGSLKLVHNGLIFLDGTVGDIADLQRYVKTSETSLPAPESLGSGIWYKRYKVNEKPAGIFTFLPPQQYISENGSVREEGTYIINGNNSLELDPECKPPYSVSSSLVENQWVWHYSDGINATYLYSHLSDIKAERYAANFKVERDAQDATYEEKFKIGPLNPDFSTASLTTAPTFSSPMPIGTDPEPEDTFPDATVFANEQVYVWKDWLCTLPECPSGFFEFFPNGRMIFYSRWGNWYATGTPTNPAPLDFVAWGKYQISGDKLVIYEDGNEVNLLHGRRRLVQQEVCFDNLTWISE